MIIMSSSDLKSLKVLLITHSFSPEFTPPQRRWKAFTEVFVNRGNTVSVVAPNTGGAPFQITDAGIRIVRYPTFGKPKRLVFKALRSALQALASIPACLFTGRQDVVIATVPALSTLLSGYIVSRLFRSNLVVDLRDSWPNLLSESNILRSTKLEPIVTKLILYVLSRADLVVTVTPGLGEVARRQGAQRISVVSNGVDLSNYTSPLPQVSHEDSRLHVLYLGNLGLSQGLDLVIQAAAKLRSSVRVRFVGDGTERARLQQLAAKLDAPVEFLHPVRGEKVLELYAWADTCLVSLRPDWPSFEHTIPSKLYELLYFNRHITGLVRGEAARIIQESKAGDIVPQEVQSLVDHLKTIRTSSALRTQNGIGQQWVLENASLDELGTRYLSELTALAEDKR